VLVVTVTRDQFVNKGPGRPVFSEQLRAETIAALACVDYVAINDWPTAVETIERIKPHLYVKGSDYARASDDVTGGIAKEEAAVRAGGGRLHFTDDITFSSSELLNSHFDVYPEEAQTFLKAFRTRYSADQIIERLEGLKDLKVLVIGETIVDEYHYVKAVGKSPKETMVTTKFLREEAFAGGILACANHVASLSDHVHVVTCLGLEDTREQFIRDHLRPHVTTKFFYRPDASTIVKRRFIEPDLSLSKMFEVSFFDDSPLAPDLEQSVCEYLRGVLDAYDLVIVIDYGHGFMGSDIVKTLSDARTFLAVNAQANSANFGFNLITKYPRADYVCIDEPEMRLAMHDRFGDLRRLITTVAGDLSAPRVTVTRGHRGATAWGRDDGFVDIPVFSRKVVDRVGAGDAYLSVTAPGAARGLPTDVVAFVGNSAGALAVAIVGNKSPVERVPLFKFITALLK
jgi:bifunctional ADP-heptose synthase (sugar kinase/adenylyltransferase)